MAERKETILEEAYRAMCRVQAMFLLCPWCGRRQPGHCADDCITVRVYLALPKD
jgi:hypothetical protein